ncbi:MAG: redoxin domain-containing protein [Haliscomenobacter sp.]|uniref:redoxin domain-containing protein n=1 Tax=Haliscomenobacter sp. TaxID=2717303 RepID=UPI0029A466C5|nr:redoxin domain-containing protein [Haliscomenobacter sp.]MDX2070842.1 redoxin domain-containing protein [Haliscomenobacter sp.]
MKLHIFQSMVLGTLLCACSSPEKQAEQADVFKANPRPVAEQTVKTLEIGATAPDFKLPGVDGKWHSLDDFKAAKALAIVFTCNHCPTAQAYEARLKAVEKDYRSKGLSVVAISPNSPLGLQYEELGYTDLNDDFEEMKIRAKNQQFDFPYLYDGDNEAVSLKYGPVATPHVFLFDAQRKLAYTGRFDAIEKPGAANAEDLRAAIDAVLAGKPVATPVTKTFGCSTKWGWKLEYKDKVQKEWEAKPVSIAKLDEAGVKKLLKNEGSEKLRLINVWATWCGPCVLEYPDFIVLQRMFGARDFEFVSLSADKPDQEAKALKFLKEKFSAVPNYLFSEEDKYALIEAVDPNWNGALPYTILVEPGGKVVWSHQGEVDFYALKRAIVEHPKIGRYY